MRILVGVMAGLLAAGAAEAATSPFAGSWKMDVAKSQLAAGVRFPPPGSPVFLSVKDDDKPWVVDLARRLLKLGYPLLATGGAHEAGLGVG